MVFDVFTPWTTPWTSSDDQKNDHRVFPLFDFRQGMGSTLQNGASWWSHLQSPRNWRNWNKESNARLQCSAGQQNVYELLALQRTATLSAAIVLINQISLIQRRQGLFGNWRRSPLLANTLVNEDRPWKQSLQHHSWRDKPGNTTKQISQTELNKQFVVSRWDEHPGSLWCHQVSTTNSVRAPSWISPLRSHSTRRMGDGHPCRTCGLPAAQNMVSTRSDASDTSESFHDWTDVAESLSESLSVKVQRRKMTKKKKTRSHRRTWNERLVVMWWTHTPCCTWLKHQVSCDSRQTSWDWKNWWTEAVIALHRDMDTMEPVLPSCWPLGETRRSRKNTGWLASSELFAFWASCFPCALAFFCIKSSLDGEGEPNIENVHVCFGVLSEQMHPPWSVWLIKQHLHWHTRHQIRAPQPHLTQTLSVCRHSACEIVLSARELYGDEAESLLSLVHPIQLCAQCCWMRCGRCIPIRSVSWRVFSPVLSRVVPWRWPWVPSDLMK